MDDETKPNITDLREVLAQRLPQHQDYMNGLLYTYRKPGTNLIAPSGFNRPAEEAPRTVRSVQDGLSKIGFVIEADGSLTTGAQNYTEIEANTARSVPETELFELQEACGKTGENKYLTTGVLGDFVALSEIGDMMNIATYTSMALEDPSKMNTHSSFVVTESTTKQLNEALELILHPERVNYLQNDEGSTLESILPESIKKAFEACRTDQERMDMLLYVAQAKQWASADEKNIRQGDVNKLRKSNPAVKMAIVLQEQDIMASHLALLLEDDTLLNDEVKNALIEIINTSREKRGDVRAAIKAAFTDTDVEGQANDYLHRDVLPQLEIADDGQDDFMVRLNEFVAGIGNQANSPQ